GTYEYLTRTKAWMNQNLGSALPALLVGLNVWNTHHIAKQAQNDGRFTADELRNMGSSAAYAANAIAALWVGPAWNRAGGMSAKLGRQTLSLTSAGYAQWAAAVASKNPGEAALASKFAAASKGLILKTVTWAALGAVAAGLEVWQLSDEINNATSEEEQKFLKAKRVVVLGMFVITGVQTVGAGLGYWLGFAWIMSTPITVAIAFLGIAYLSLTMTINRYKREGLRLWLYHCNWGQGAIPDWLGDTGHLKQMQALLETLQRPSVSGRVLYSGGGSTPRKWLGFWVQVQVPAALSGKEIILQPAMINKHHFSQDELLSVKDRFYDQFLNGNWADPKTLGVLPNSPKEPNVSADFSYLDSEQPRLWQVWINTSTQNPILELEIKYPAGVLQRNDGRGYMFRIAFDRATTDSDRVNTPFNSVLEAENDIVLARNSTVLLKLAVPNSID
ncbi:T6SS effector BTH_I2691 family protein, partial [Pseudomonas sp. SDO528_S397]